MAGSMLGEARRTKMPIGNLLAGQCTLSQLRDGQLLILLLPTLVTRRGVREAELGGVSVKIEAVNHPVTAAIYRSNSELAESFISGLSRESRNDDISSFRWIEKQQLTDEAEKAGRKRKSLQDNGVFYQRLSFLQPHEYYEDKED
ncbi:hypothetical protein LSTR_LSTR007382 [Laodelphax striatellus]|uniref:Uncharacterized protein n=1 Tax=Laodelphax striatellus TaxID=195883 RepID=A0A482XMT9_LAOST|nr:hypothetical protein LSTR_LSTR007382 [Laodelphax striatellus]